MRVPNKIRYIAQLAISLQISWLPGSQNFNSRLCDPRGQVQSGYVRLNDVTRLQQCFFELGTSLSVCRRRCPVIGPMNFFPITSQI
jgi:hypothetical protein